MKTRRTNREKAHDWIAAHPEAMGLFKHFAELMLMRRRSFGINALLERVRWEVKLNGRDEDGLKINNNHAPHIARWLIDELPALEGLISFRVMRAADRPAGPVTFDVTDPDPKP